MHYIARNIDSLTKLCEAGEATSIASICHCSKVPLRRQGNTSSVINLLASCRATDGFRILQFWDTGSNSLCSITISNWTYVYITMYYSASLCIHIYIDIWIYICICVCMYICEHIYIYIYICAIVSAHILPLKMHVAHIWGGKCIQKHIAHLEHLSIQPIPTFVTCDHHPRDGQSAHGWCSSTLEFLGCLKIGGPQIIQNYSRPLLFGYPHFRKPLYWIYTLVNCHITMENHHFSWLNWLNQRTKWPFSMSQTVSLDSAWNKSTLSAEASTCGAPWTRGVRRPAASPRFCRRLNKNNADLA